MLCLLLVSTGARAETVRVTSWNLGSETNMENSVELVGAAASTLKDLAPDFILLQGMRDWHLCQELAAALRPLQYNVLICTDFQRNTPLLPARPQLAILSRIKAYFVWSESWSAARQPDPAGGVAFAAVDVGTQRLGFFTALLADPGAAQDSVKRLVDEMNLIGHWETNQVQSFVVAASFVPASGSSDSAVRHACGTLENAGLVDATEALPSSAKTTVRSMGPLGGTTADFVLAGPEGFPLNPRVTLAPVAAHYPVTCDVELDPDKVSTALALRAESIRLQQAQTELLRKRAEYAVGAAVGLGLLVLVARKAWGSKAAMPGTSALGPPSPPLLKLGPGGAPAAVRPVIFAQAPPKDSQPVRVPLPQPARPVLRLQPSARRQPGSSPLDLDLASRNDPQPASQDMERAPQDAATPLDPSVEHRPEVKPGPEATLRHGVVQELSGWLKQKLLRKLVTDRAQLMEAQQIATRMATNLDGRLSRIEAQIQQQNQAYVRRIEELNQELAAAREENRELIRERIAQVKAEMEAARAKVLAEANLDNSSFRL